MTDTDVWQYFEWKAHRLPELSSLMDDELRVAQADFRARLEKEGDCDGDDRVHTMIWGMGVQGYRAEVVRDLGDQYR